MIKQNNERVKLKINYLNIGDNQNYFGLYYLHCVQIGSVYEGIALICNILKQS